MKCVKCMNVDYYSNVFLLFYQQKGILITFTECFHCWIEIPKLFLNAYKPNALQINRVQSFIIHGNH